MNKQTIAKEVLKKPFFDNVLKEYLKWLNKEEYNENTYSEEFIKNLDIVFDYIEKDGYDMTGFILDEIPHSCVFVFMKENKISFDIYINDFNDNGKQVSAGFVNDKSNTEDAKNIEEAINNFCLI